MSHLVDSLPKAELHLHIEGTLEPELLFKLAKRNRVQLPNITMVELKKQYQFSNLQSFLTLYYQATQVLKSEEDFFELAWSYFQKAAEQNIRHVEFFFDPQTHTNRNVPFSAVIEGLHRARLQARVKLGLSSYIIACFLRDLDPYSAMQTLDHVLDHQDKIIGVGLDSAERNHPPCKFKTVFDRARDAGLRVVAHAGEEGPPDYIWEALDLLKAERIDHGISCLQDAELVAHLVEKQIPLTVCPLSNVKLQVIPTLKDHPIKKMLQKNLCVTINSDDPAYFGGYLNENLIAIQTSLNLSDEEIKQLLINSFQASFLDKAEKEKNILAILRP